MFFFILDYDSMCSETDNAQEKVNFHVLESPIPPLTAAALRMIICKRLALKPKQTLSLRQGTTKADQMLGPRLS